MAVRSQYHLYSYFVEVDEYRPEGSLCVLELMNANDVMSQRPNDYLFNHLTQH